MPSAHDSASSKKDVVSEYRLLVGSFVVLQLVGWTLSLLEVLEVVGPVAYAVLQSLVPLDLSFCLAMYAQATRTC
jgi:hypothetical protein